MSIELKIKAKHLALEPQIIKHEEQKLKKQIKNYKISSVDEKDLGRERLILKLNSLANHRKHDVRREARATHLARAYLAGKPYLTVEQKRKDEVAFRYIVQRVVEMVRKYKYTSNNIELLRKDITREVIVEWAKIG